jgi:hypothetical protein
MLIWAVLMALLTLIVLVVYWLNYPYQTITFDQPIFSIESKTVKGGEILFFISNYCKHTNVAASITRVFKNDILFYTPTSTGNIGKGCGAVRVGVSVPEELPKGEYVIENIYRYRVNPIREIVVRQDTEMFVVK